MVFRQLGRTGQQIPAIGQGTWRMGERRTEDRQAIEALRLGIELGMTLIDTAEMYASGRAEELVAQAVAGVREKVFLVTKVLPDHASYEGVLQAARDSLRRLRTEWIDLYLLHWPSDRYPLSETMRAMAQLVRDGLVRYVGVSNFSAAQVDEARQLLGEVPLVCNQVFYWLGQRAAELRLLPQCEKEGITLMAYSPLGGGRFVRPGTRRAQVLERVARRVGATPHQVALAWLLHRSPAVVTIPKAVRPEHVRQNARAADLALSPQDLQELDQAFPVPATDEPLPVL
ncbi:MAG TPA: aldo/keto reductase [Limnochordales bacterium]